MSASDVIAEYERTGRRFTAAGVGSFVIEAGAGEPVVCMHGVPASAYLYRKVVPALGRRGLRGIAFDLPGSGWRTGRTTSTTRGPASGDGQLPRSTSWGWTTSISSSTTSAGRSASRWQPPCPSEFVR